MKIINYKSFEIRPNRIYRMKSICKSIELRDCYYRITYYPVEKILIDIFIQLQLKTVVPKDNIMKATLPHRGLKKY